MIDWIEVINYFISYTVQFSDGRSANGSIGIWCDKKLSDIRDVNILINGRVKSYIEETTGFLVTKVTPIQIKRFPL